MALFGPTELSADVLEQGLCVGCGACVRLCPYFASHRGKTAMLFPCSAETGRCHAYCPKTEVDLDAIARHFSGTGYTGDPTGSCRAVFAARAARKDPNGNFQDGGTVSALMRFALESGIIDAAVLTGQQAGIPAPGIATRPDAVDAYASSKYAAAPTLSALHDGVRQGFSRMGVVGTPCQMTALAQMRLNPTKIENYVHPVALSIGLFCTWALDARRFASFAAERAGSTDIRKIRIPPPPAGIVVIETATGSVNVPLEEIRSLVLAGCGFCPDMTAEWADVSVGALEGADGWNTLIVRTKAGENLVREAIGEGRIVTEALPDSALAQLTDAAAVKKARALEKARRDGRLNTAPDENRRSVLRVNEDALKNIQNAKGKAT